MTEKEKQEREERIEDGKEDEYVFARTIKNDPCSKIVNVYCSPRQSAIDMNFHIDVMTKYVEKNGKKRYRYYDVKCPKKENWEKGNYSIPNSEFDDFKELDDSELNRHWFAFRLVDVENMRKTEKFLTFPVKKIMKNIKEIAEDKVSYWLISLEKAEKLLKGDLVESDLPDSPK